MNISSIGPTLAQKGMQTMNRLPQSDDKARAEVGEQYLGSIAKSSENELEKTVAKMALQAAAPVPRTGLMAALGFGPKALHPRVRDEVFASALKHIASGVSGPAAAVLSMVGYSAMSMIPTALNGDKAHVGKDFVAMVRDHSSDPAQKVDAENALAIADKSANHRSAFLTRTFLGEQFSRPQPPARPPSSGGGGCG